MLVWTMQPKIVYEEIKDKEYFVTDPKYTEYNYLYYGKWDKQFRDAYDWLVNELKTRLPKPKGYKNIKLPIWSYYKENGLHEKINMRVHGKYQRKPYVLFELDIPDNEIVLLDSDVWISVLNNFPDIFCYNEYEYEIIDEFYDSLSIEDKEKFKLRSWSTSLFDMTGYKKEDFEDGWWINHNDVEGVFWVLKKEYINKVWIYDDEL